MRAERADLLGAGAQRGHRDDHTHQKVRLFRAVFAGKQTAVLHHAFGSGDGRHFLQEIRKLDFHVRRLRAKLLPHLFQDGLKRLDVDLPPKIVEHFHKPAHVRALEVMGQVDIHVDGGVHRLRAAHTVQHDDRVFDVFHPDLFDVDMPGVFLVLNINHHKKWAVGNGQWAMGDGL